MLAPFRAPALACTLTLLAATSCSSVPQASPAPVEAGEFLDWIERVYVEAELARHGIA